MFTTGKQFEKHAQSSYVKIANKKLFYLVQIHIYRKSLHDSQLNTSLSIKYL